MISRIRKRSKFDRSLSLSLGDRFDGIRLAGDFSTLAYHYATISIGSPPQSFSFVIDTASALLALPCSGCATCGQRQRKFARADSTSSHIVGCGIGGESDCDSCVKLTDDGPGECAYERSYSEGSSSSGVFVKDLVRFFGDRTENVEMKFGCQLQADGQIAEQGVDGILGLSQGSLSMLSTMNRKGLLPRNAFSLCMNSLGRGGVMTLGGADPRLHAPLGTSGTGSTKMFVSERNGFYMLQLDSVRVIPSQDTMSLSTRRRERRRRMKNTETENDHDTAIISSQKLRGLVDSKWMIADSSTNTPISMVLDTGSTYSYLRRDVLTYVLSSIKELCASISTTGVDSHAICKGEIVQDRELPEQQVLCFRGLQDGWDSGMLNPTSQESISLPTLQMKFADSSVLDIPVSRLLMRTDWTAGLHCLGLFPSSKAGGLVVLGANAMHGLDVTFDAEGSAWAWSPSNCSSNDATLRTVSATDAENDNAHLGILLKNPTDIQFDQHSSGSPGADDKSLEALRSLFAGVGVGIIGTMFALIGLLMFRGMKRKGERGYSRVAS